jgi:nucleoside-triphosphatase
MPAIPAPPRILLTGRPGCGKTTVIRRAAELIGLERCVGFYTEEVREKGRRVGFDVVTLDGRRGRLARVGARGPRVSRYGVDLESFEALGVETLERALLAGARLLVVDEIGKMELFSTSFRQAVLDALEGGRCLLGTILLGPNPFADSIKARPDVRVIELTESNRADVGDRAISLVRACLEKADQPP